MEPTPPTQVTTPISPMVNRLPAKERPKKKNPFNQKLDVRNFELVYSFDEQTHIVKNVVAITREMYRSSMGPVISMDIGYAYLKSQSDISEGKLTALNSKKKQLVPISHIIKINDIDEEKRNEILEAGYRESLYFDHLKQLYIETSSSDYMDIFEALRLAGYNPQYQTLDKIYEGR